MQPSHHQSDLPIGLDDSHATMMQPPTMEQQLPPTMEYVLFDNGNDELMYGQKRSYSNDSLSTTEGIIVLGHSRTPPDDNFASWNSNWTGRFLNNLWFKRILIVFIMLHSIIVALSTTDYVQDDEQWTRIVAWTRRSFLILFSIELVLRLIRHKANPLRSGWLFFDTCVILGSWLLPEMLILRTFRVLRSLRHASRFHHLKTIIVALGKAVGGAVAIVYLLGIVLYIFAVIFTSNFKESFPDAYGRLDVSLLTLFEVMTLDNWSDLARNVMDEYRWAWVPYCAFITVSTLFLANFIVAVLISAVVPTNNVAATDNNNIGSGHDLARLETKVDQLLGVLEAIRQRQNHLDDVGGGGVVMESNRTARTATMTIDEAGEEVSML